MKPIRLHTSYKGYAVIVSGMPGAWRWTVNGTHANVLTCNKHTSSDTAEHARTAAMTAIDEFTTNAARQLALYFARSRQHG